MKFEGNTVRTRTASVKYMLLAVLIGLLIAAAYTSVLIIKRQSASRDTGADHVTALVNQATLDVSRLHGTIAAAMIPGNGVSLRDVELRLAIVLDDAKRFESNDTKRLVASSPELAGTIDTLKSTVLKAQLLFEKGVPAKRLQMLLETVGTLNAPMAQLAELATSRNAELMALDKAQLNQLQRIFGLLLSGITVCGVSLAGALTWHNRLLSQAQYEAQRQNRSLMLRDLELNTQNALFNAALNNMSQALCMVDVEQRLIVCNTRFLELFGITSHDAAPGMLVADIFKSIAVSGRYEHDMIANMFAIQLLQPRARGSYTFTEQDSAGRALAVSQEPMGDGGWVATFEDITERRAAETRIQFMAHHDTLTQLPNRVLFHDRLSEALERHRAHDEYIAVLCLDLDRFKLINDTLGHPTGDALLKAVARRLQENVRGCDLVVRLGGDEFAILQIGGNEKACSEALATRIVEEFRRPYEVDGHSIVVATSIGIAMASKDLDHADTLLRSADTALYCSKSKGRGTYCFFDASMDAEIQERRALEADLREALGRDEFELYYQPMVSMATDRVSGFEALIRWNHPVRGRVSPDSFIPIAEELGLIVDIGEWALVQACHAAASWPSDVKVSVNLSPVQIRHIGLIPSVEAALACSGLPSSRLELEITESALLQESEGVLATLHQLRGLGINIALDDFGIGYSSLSYLRSFPFTKLKVDQSFTKEILVRSNCEAIVRSVTSLAHTLGMTTTIEGVETEEQLDRLRDVGCTQVQGYLFDKPLPLSAIGKWFLYKDEIKTLEFDHRRMVYAEAAE
jgi:diguanylate cyclase (GGDEF)-like protein